MIQRVRFVVHEGKPEAKAAYDELVSWLAGRQIDIVDDDAELIVSLGGDGTMLRAAVVASECDALLLGVNLGHLGYLTEVDAGEECEALQKVLSGDFHVEERLMLRCESHPHDGGPSHHIGLNEVLVERPARHRLARLAVDVGNERLTTFNGDGVLVATPTGSTAYALSAGGPIVAPRAQCMVLVPVSPHRFFSRPVVLADDESVRITVDDGSGPANLSLDGEAREELLPGSWVEVRRSPQPLRLVRLEGPGFLTRLRLKLDLPS
jgi:NAD+ kinase